MFINFAIKQLYIIENKEMALYHVFHNYAGVKEVLI